MSGQPMYRVGPVAHRSHVEVNCKHDVEKIVTDERVWNNDGHVNCELAWDFPGRIEERSVYIGEVVFEFVENHIHGGDQQALARSNLGGTMVPRLPEGLSNEERQTEIARMVWKMIRLVGIAVTDGLYDAWGAKNDFPAIVSGLISCMSPLRVTRGDMIMARLAAIRGSNTHLKRRPTIELVPVTPETLRTEVVDRGDMRNLLETHDTVEFLKSMFLLTHAMYVGALEEGGLLVGDDAELFRNGSWFTQPRIKAGSKSLGNITRITQAPENEMYNVTVSNDPNNPMPVTQMDKMAEAMIQELKDSDALLDFFKRDALPFSGIMMSLITSRIMGVATKGCNENGRFDLMLNPPTRALIDRVK